MYGLMENAIYGGRVDNTSDLLVLGSYVRQIFNDSVVTGKNKPSKVTPLPCGNIPLSTRINVSGDLGQTRHVLGEIDMLVGLVLIAILAWHDQSYLVP